jgi:hypothetical protein
MFTYNILLIKYFLWIIIFITQNIYKLLIIVSYMLLFFEKYICKK